MINRLIENDAILGNMYRKQKKASHYGAHRRERNHQWKKNTSGEERMAK